MNFSFAFRSLIRTFVANYELELYFENGHHLYGGNRSLHADRLVLDVAGHHDSVGRGMVVYQFLCSAASHAEKV